MRSTSHGQPPRQSGFTLIELMVVLTVLAIVLTSAAPSFSAFMASLQIKAVAYDLASDLMLARNEALKRNTTIRVAPNGSAWVDGWKIEVASSTTRVKTRSAPNARTTFTDAPTAITFGGNGRVTLPTDAVRVTLGHSDATEATQRCVQLDISGRARAEKGACS